MNLFRKTLCKLGHHPHVRFVGDTTGWLQCQDCRRITKFAVAEKWDHQYPWITEEEWMRAVPADHRTDSEDRAHGDGRPDS